VIIVGALSKSLLLFILNWLDGQLTLMWIRMNVATEGNGIMAHVLGYGEVPFIGVKLIIGAFAAYILYRCAHLPIAKHGMRLVLTVYSALMLVHVATGCAALGWHGPETLVGYINHLPKALIALVS
jgi:hypothetical protein